MYVVGSKNRYSLSLSLSLCYVVINVYLIIVNVFEEMFCIRIPIELLHTSIHRILDIDYIIGNSLQIKIVLCSL